MKELKTTPLKLKDGTTIFVEILDNTTKEDSRVSEAGRTSKVINDVVMSFDEIFEPLNSLCSSVSQKFSDILTQENEVTLEFGLKLNLSGNLIVASASSEANFKITMKLGKAK